MSRTAVCGPETFVEDRPYRLMPFQFGRLVNGRVLLTTPCGEFATLDPSNFSEFVTGRLSPRSPEYVELQSKHFLTHGPDATTLRVAASQWRTKKGFLEGGPKLHIFVPTLRCNQNCGYCQVSRASTTAPDVDITRETAAHAIDVMLSTPAAEITMEFQGGEPLLAFDLVRFMVETASQGAASTGKTVQFVICTNLTLLSDEHLAFFRDHGISVSTSLDGPSDLHAKNRPMTGAAAHEVVVRNMRRCQDVLGEGSLSALMTTTLHSLNRAQEIVDEYVARGQHSIFIRELNPYGYAAKSGRALGYSVDQFAAFYGEALAYILALNRKGVAIAEGYATMLVRKIMTPFGVGFTDMQSPTGEGFGVVLYNYDGGVYASDEARMLAEMGDHSFRLGNVKDGYVKLFFGETMQCIAAAGCAEALPGCADCVYLPYCGADPIRHYRTQGDLIGHRPTSSFCKKQKAIFEILFTLLTDSSSDSRDILLSWIYPSRRELPRSAWLL